MLRPHILVSPEPLIAGKPYTALCGTEIERAAWVWQVVEPGSSAKAVLNRIGTCQRCFNSEWDGRYLYGAVEESEAGAGDTR